MAYHRGDRAQAESYARQAVSIQSSLIVPWINLAKFQDSMGRYWQELSTLEEALQMHPNDQVLLTLRGRAERQLSKYREAEADLTRVITLSPSFALPHYQRGLTFLSQRRYDDAIADLDRYLTRIEPGKPLLRIHFDRSVSIDDLGANGSKDYYASAYWARAQAWIGKNDLLRAHRDFQTALQYNDVGRLLDYCGEPGARLTNDPIVECDAAVTLMPDRPEVRVRRARWFLRANDIKSARSDLNYAVQLNPQLASALTELGYLETQAGKTEAAVARFTRALQFDPLNGDSHVGLAEAYAADHMDERAVKTLDAAILIGVSRILAIQSRHSSGRAQ